MPGQLMVIPTGPAFDLSIRASLIENHSPPEILVHGLVTPDDVDKLFDMYVATPTGLVVYRLTCLQFLHPFECKYWLLTVVQRSLNTA